VSSPVSRSMPDRRSSSRPKHSQSKLPPRGRLAGKAVSSVVSVIAHASASPRMMSDEGHMDDSESGLLNEGDGDAGADDVVSNSDLANRRRRQQVRQACQQCRRRKIKVHIPSPCPYFIPPPSFLPPALIRTILFLTRHTSAMRSDPSAGLAKRPGSPAPTSCLLDRRAPRP
jgi:hypothetical protein